MEPVTTTLKIAQEAYETAKNIQKVYNVSKQMKTVAESEGKDQIMATKDLVGTASKMNFDDSNSKLSKEGSDLLGKYVTPTVEGPRNMDVLVDRPTEHLNDTPIPNTEVFVDKIPFEKAVNNLPEESTFVDKLSNDGIAKKDSDVLTEMNPKETELNAVSNSTTEIHTTDEVSDEPRTIKTINDGLVGQKHPETGVPYVEKVVETDTGEKVKGVFPQFESKMDVQLPEELHQASDRAQFAECNRQLKELLNKNPELKKLFTEGQLADIEDGITPEGYTWHHNEEKGKMQLVDTDIHSRTRHTGGRNIWGGGTENRR